MASGSFEKRLSAAAVPPKKVAQWKVAQVRWPRSHVNKMGQGSHSAERMPFAWRVAEGSQLLQVWTGEVGVP